MSTLLASLGRWSFRHPWRVLVSWLLLLAIIGGTAALISKGFDDNFAIPGAESQEGLEELERTFPEVAGAGAQFIVVAAEGDEIEDADYRDPIELLIDDIADLDGISAATSPYDSSVSGSISDDRSAALARVQFDGAADAVTDAQKDALATTVHELRDELPDGSIVSLGGDLYAVELPALSIVEAIGVMVALIVLAVTFRSLLFAGVPLIIALLGVGVAMFGVLAATQFTSVSSTTPLLALMLGLAVGIDYALFIAARHQDQLRDGVAPEESAARATGTAGSAVVFAGVTVVIALVGLGFAGIPFLTVMGVSAAAAVAVAVLVAVTLTPAFLSFLGMRAVGRPRKAKRKQRTPFSERWVAGATKRPLVTTIAIVVGLGAMLIPATNLQLALPNAGTLPESSEARQTFDLVDEHFGAGANSTIIITGTIVTSDDPLQLMDDLRAAVEEVPGVADVPLATPNATADTGIVQVTPETGPSDPATGDLVRELRSQHQEWLDEFGVDVKVTGFTAVSIDISDQLFEALIPFGIFVIGLSFVLLMIVFRSIWVPLKAALGYLLSVAAAFGAVVIVFEWGFGADLLHVSREGPVIAFMPIVVMGVLFGLAMDYEVFLVSRMREDFVHGARAKGATSEVARTAVRTGFHASARVVTAAAVIMFAVFAAFVPEGDSNIKPIALALSVGITVDAFLVRMTLVPAVMTLLGRHAWTLPGWLQRKLPHLDIEGEAVERERENAEWPAEGDAVVVAADGLAVSDRNGALVESFSVRVAPGEALVLTGDEQAAKALLLTFGARFAAAHGKLRVGGHLLPGREAWVRRETSLALAGGSHGRAAIRAALKGSPAVVLIDGIDALTAADRDQAAAALRDAARSPADAPPRPAVIVTAHDATSAESLLRDAGFDSRTITLPSAAPAASTTSEVIA